MTVQNIVNYGDTVVIKAPLSKLSYLIQPLVKDDDTLTGELVGIDQDGDIGLTNIKINGKIIKEEFGCLVFGMGAQAFSPEYLFKDGKEVTGIVQYNPQEPLVGHEVLIKDLTECFSEEDSYDEFYSKGDNATGFCLAKSGFIENTYVISNLAVNGTVVSGRVSTTTHGRNVILVKQDNLEVIP